MRLLGVLLTIAFIALTGTMVWGQSTAQISGTARDQSGAVLPGVEITLAQTNTGLVRMVVTNETGSYVLPNLPIGPYKLEAALAGFRTFVQTGILLQVGSSPVINVALEVGQVSENVEVQADAALVETRSTGIGQVIDNVRVLELPLNGRDVTSLILLSGGAVGGGTQSTNRTWPTNAISVSGGLQDGLTFHLDGGMHSDPYNALNLPIPFPDAVQEFKVETSAVPAQYGEHAGGAVNVITKSGTNEFHGDLFEFVRNRVFNSRNAFGTVRDPLKRNQFGGVLGGPIVRNKLFFFGGHQSDIVRSQSPENTAFIPTPQMLAGDWTTIASPACNSGRQITLKAPFVNNRIDPAMFSSPAVVLATKYNPVTNDPCGAVKYARNLNSDATMDVGKIDYQRSNTHSIFGRYQLGRLDNPSDYDGKSWFSLGQGDYTRRLHSFVLGDTYSFSPNMVSAFRGTIIRTLNEKTIKSPQFNYADLGVNFTPKAGYPKIVMLMVSGAFSSGPGGAGMHTPGITNTTNFEFAEDVSWLRGSHQIGFGGDFIHRNQVFKGTANAVAGHFSFTAQTTGMSMGDFMLGLPALFRQGTPARQDLRQNYSGFYIQDTWKATSKLTLNGGIRWEPLLWLVDVGDRAGEARFSRTAFDQNVHTTVYKNAPAGLLFTGDQGIPDIGNRYMQPRWWNFAPRVGLAYDPKGDGLTVIRAAYGLFYDNPPLQNFGVATAFPRAITIGITNPAGGFQNPWLGYPGGNPFPLTVDANVPFLPSTNYPLLPTTLKEPMMNQWNLSVQKQIGNNWLVSGNYLGNNVIHILSQYQINSPTYLPGASCVINGRTYTPCSSTSNTDARRILSLANPNQGQFYAAMGLLQDGGTRTFDSLKLTVQRRRFKGMTFQGSYTWSHCIDDGFIDNGLGTVDITQRRLFRGDCQLDRRQNLITSTVYETPQFANTTLRLLGTGWRISGIFGILSGAPLIVSTGLPSLGIAPGLEDDKPRQILASPYPANKSIKQWVNPAAFLAPVAGQYGPQIAELQVLGPKSVQIDLSLVRTFKIRERQSIEFRAEAFNAPNHVNPGNPSTSLSDSNFGRILSATDPRIMQMAMKFVF